MRQLTPKQLMVPAVVGLTLAHLAVRVAAQDDRQALDVSPLAIGAVVDVATLAAQAATLPFGECLEVIAFSPDCPFCQHAATREREEQEEADRAERVWVTDMETASLPYFVSEHLQRPPLISADLFEALKIQAVPALFVLSATGEVRWVGAYYGNETDVELIERCTGADDGASTTT